MAGCDFEPIGAIFAFAGRVSSAMHAPSGHIMDSGTALSLSRASDAYDVMDNFELLVGANLDDFAGDACCERAYSGCSQATGRRPGFLSRRVGPFCAECDSQVQRRMWPSHTLRHDMFWQCRVGEATHPGLGARLPRLANRGAFPSPSHTW